MAAGVIIGGAVGVATLYLWGWQRFKYMRAYWRNNKQTVEFERKFRRVRDDGSIARTYRAATASDAKLVALLRVAEADEDELEACGFTLLGDVVVERAQPPNGIVRALVDRSQTTCATLLVIATAPSTVWLSLASYRDGETFSTTRGQQALLAEPPNLHRQALAPDLPSAKLVGQHRSFAHGDPMKPFARIGTVEELIAQAQKSRNETLRWRETRETDALLDADLRSVLGAQYDTIGKAWARRLRSRLPSATLRRS